MIDLSLKVGTVTLLALLAVLLFRDFRGVVAGRLAVALALGAAAHAVSVQGFTVPVAVWRAPLIALATGNVVVLWLSTRALFDDGFRLRWWHATPWAVVVSLSLVNCLVLFPTHIVPAQLMGAALNVIALGFIALAIVQSVASWSVDLVEGRRNLRVAIVAAACVYGVVNAVLQLAMFGHESTEIVTTANAAILAVIVVGIAYALTRIDGEGVFSVTSVVGSAVRRPSHELPEDGVAMADQRLIDALNRLMADDRIYRHEGMTIGMLATRLAVPEYRLRQLINQRLGYRNFSVFLNDHRIAEVKVALADPTQIEVPVITIAMDAGFQSLGPFNRAFKANTGVTPSEYRRLNAAPA